MNRWWSSLIPRPFRLWEPGYLLPGITAGFLVGMLAVISEASLAALIYGGELSAFISRGIGFALFGAAVALAVQSLFSSFSGVVALPTNTPAVIISLISAAVAAGLSGEGGTGEAFITVVFVIVMISFLTGIFFLLLGAFNVGRLIRFIPYPVIGGFMAGTGWLLVRGGLKVLAGRTPTLAAAAVFLRAELIIRWLPGLLFALLLLFALRRYRHYATMPALILFGVGVFYLLQWLTGHSLDSIREQGWLIGPFPGGHLWKPVQWGLLRRIHWVSVKGQLGNISIAVLVSSLAVLMNISGLELAHGVEADLNRELSSAGFANLLAGAVGSPPVYHTVSLTTLASKIGGKSRLVGPVAALVCGSVLVSGAGVISFFPRPVLGGLLLFMGFSFLVKWLIETWRRLSKMDYLLILVILFVIGTFGFLQGVGVGVLAAALIFVVNYSKIDVIAQEHTGETIRSNVDRPPDEQRELRSMGGRLSVLKLEGFIFFGTAHSLFQKVHRRLHDGSAPALRFIILDFERVTGFDGSAEIAFTKIMRLSGEHDVDFVMTGLPTHLRRRVERCCVRNRQSAGIWFFGDLDHGLEWCEYRMLGSGGEGAGAFRGSIHEHLRTMFPRRDDRETIIASMERESIEPGRYVIRQGEPARALFLLESGELAAQLEIEGKEPVRLRTMRPGTVFGEIALYLGTPRSVAVTATRPSSIYRLTEDALSLLKKNTPELAIEFQAYIIRLLSERLVDLNRTIAALSE